MKNIMRNKEVKLFAVIFAVFIASMMLFATTTHAATITTKNMPSTSVFVRSSKTLTKPSVSGFKWKAVNNTYYTLTTLYSDYCRKTHRKEGRNRKFFSHMQKCKICI